MDLYPVYNRPLTLQYRARPFSESTIFFLLISITARYLVPLILVWNSDGFWLKESQFREMPEIHFKKRFILLLEGVNRSTGDYEQYGFSTFSGINHAFRTDTQYYAPVQIEDYELDFNLDTKLDQLNLKLTAPIDLTQSAIHSLNLILFFDYRLESRIDLRMETVAQFRIQNWAPGKGVRLEGVLELVQQMPFFHKGFDYRYNHSLLSDSGEHLHLENEDEEEDPLILENTRPEFQLQQFLEAYYKRDYYTQSQIRVSHWDPVIQGLANPDPSDIYSFNIELTLQYQDQLFQYETGFWYLLKWAFIQYFSVWILTNWAVKKLESIVYEGYMVPTVRLLREQKLLFGLLSQSNCQDNNKKFI